MTQSLYNFNDNDIVFPPVKINNDNRGGGGETTLTVIYSHNGKKYYIDCKSSLCKTMYVFQEDDHGTSWFDKDSESFVGSTLPLDDDYMLNLRRAIKVWKKLFNRH